ncbi:MAG: hypothetical protein Q7R45_05650 [Sulfuricaulis sp.]|nr:hypothetical protein [Sulfuricaulis sp.]
MKLRMRHRSLAQARFCETYESPLIDGTANAITGRRDITRTVGGRLVVLHRFTASYNRLHISPDAYEDAPPRRVKTCDFSRFNPGPHMAMGSNTLLRFAVEFPRPRSHHSDTGQRTKTLRIVGINVTLALPLFLRLP